VLSEGFLALQNNCFPKEKQEESIMASLFRSVFLKSFALEEPLIELYKIPHWVRDKAAQSMLPTEINLCKAYITEGFFYQFYSKVPSLTEIENHITQAQTLGAQVLVIPNIRDCEDVNVLKDKEFIRVPGPTEAIVNMEENIDQMISTRTSGFNLREIRRYKRLADRDYELSYYKSQELPKNLIKVIAELHELLIKKHDLPHNIYNERAIEEMISNDPDNSILFILRHEKNTACPVQAMILIQAGPHELHYQTQAINRNIVPFSQNLYKASFYELFFYARDKSFKIVNLGRGDAEVKTSRYAANLSISQSNWIKCIS